MIKNLILLLLILLSYNADAQKSSFVRVYNLAGEKINKGYVISVTDTSLQLKDNSTLVAIPVRSIGFIKTKRSAGNNVLVGSVIGATTGAVLGAVTAEPDAGFMAYTAGEGAAAGALLGSVAGAVIGGLTILAKNPDTYLINGDVSKWKAFQSLITGKNN